MQVIAAVFEDPARIEVANYVGAVFSVYSLVIIAWIVVNFIFALGVSVPFSRPANAVLDFLRDTSEPFLRIFRRLGLRIGPIDLSPIVALLVLGIVGNLVVSIIEG